MKGFVIVQKTEARRLVKQLLADVLQMSFSEFEQRLTDAGIKQTDGYRKDEKGENYKVRIYRAKKILSDSRIHQLETIEESNATDEFPKDL